MRLILQLLLVLLLLRPATHHVSTLVGEAGAVSRSRMAEVFHLYMNLYDSITSQNFGYSHWKEVSFSADTYTW